MDGKWRCFSFKNQNPVLGKKVPTQTGKIHGNKVSKNILKFIILSRFPPKNLPWGRPQWLRLAAASATALQPAGRGVGVRPDLHGLRHVAEAVGGGGLMMVGGG